VRRGRGEVGRGEVGTADSINKHQPQNAWGSNRPRPHLSTTGLEGRLAERADPSSPSCPLIGGIGKSGSVFMGIITKPFQMRGPQSVRCLQERRCADVRDGGTEGGREGRRERSRRERRRGKSTGRIGGQRSQRFVTALPYYYRSRGGHPS
jgi:hypothetical protein